MSCVGLVIDSHTLKEVTVEGSKWILRRMQPDGVEKLAASLSLPQCGYERCMDIIWPMCCILPKQQNIASRHHFAAKKDASAWDHCN
jgi:hypothetical protein